MILEYLILVFAMMIAAVAAIVITYMVANVAPSIAEIKAAADVRKARIEARADLALGSDDFSERESDESAGEPSTFDAVARMLGYSDVSSALTDPALMDKFSGILGGKDNGEKNIET